MDDFPVRLEGQAYSPGGCLIAVTDITTEKAAQEELLRLNETLAECDLVALKARLLSQQVEQPLALLRRENGLAEPDATQIAALTLADLLQLHRTLIQDRRRWRVLFTGGNT